MLSQQSEFVADVCVVSELVAVVKITFLENDVKIERQRRTENCLPLRSV